MTKENEKKFKTLVKRLKARSKNKKYNNKLLKKLFNNGSLEKLMSCMTPAEYKAAYNKWKKENGGIMVGGVSVGGVNVAGCYGGKKKKRKLSMWQKFMKENHRCKNYNDVLKQLRKKKTSPNEWLIFASNLKEGNIRSYKGCSYTRLNGKIKKTDKLCTINKKKPNYYIKSFKEMDKLLSNKKQNKKFLLSVRDRDTTNKIYKIIENLHNYCSVIEKSDLCDIPNVMNYLEKILKKGKYTINDIKKVDDMSNYMKKLIPYMKKEALKRI